MMDAHFDNLIQTLVALRFGLLTLACVAIYWSLEDIARYVKLRRSKEQETPPAPLFVSYGFVGLAAILSAPLVLNRALKWGWTEETTFGLQVVAMLLTMAFFLTMNASRQLYYGSTYKEAVARTVPVLLATVILIGIGASLDVQYQ